MPYRPLAVVSGLTIGDYLLWNWSLGANHEIVALVSGLTLPPLAIVFIWLSVVAIAHVIARSAARSRQRRGRELQLDDPSSDRAQYDGPLPPATASRQSTAAGARPPDKLAA